MLPKPPAHVIAVARRLSGAGFQVVVVGGAVRDSLVGRQVKDWDLATDATPDQVRSLCPGTSVTTRFGTALVPAGGEIIEVTTFRTEADYADYRRPNSVGFTRNLVVDLSRRDFTINAIAYDPLTRALCDPFGGQHDLAARLVRCVGDPALRFGEDALRLFRAARFAASLGFRIEPATARAMATRAALVGHLAAERVGIELYRTFTAPFAQAGFEALNATGVLRLVLPEAARSGASDHIARALARVDRRNPTLALAAVMHHGAADPAEAARLAAGRLKSLALGEDLANAAAQRVFVANVSFSPAWSEAQLARAVRNLDPGAVNDGLALRTACGGHPHTELLTRRVAALRDSRLPLSLRELACNGNDLIGLGVAPGPGLGRILNELLEATVERRVANSKPALLDHARTIA